MGQCATKSKKPVTTVDQPRRRGSSSLPIDTLEVYNFLVTISHLKLRGLSSVGSRQDTYYLTLTWEGRVFKTEAVTGSELKFANEWVFETQETVQHLQDQYMTAALFAQKQEKLLAQVCISLWSITTGPSYQNFALLNSKSQVIGRLGMDIKVLQQTQLSIDALHLSCALDNEVKGHFSISLRYAGEVDLESKRSEVSENADWTFPSTQEDLGKKVGMKFGTNIENLRSDSLQFRVWKHKKTEEPVLVAECWIGLTKLLKSERFGILQRELSKQTKFLTPPPHSDQGFPPPPDTLTQEKSGKEIKPFQEKLWSYGRQIGSITGEMMVSNIPVISQQICGVNTEDGIQIQSTNFMNSKSVGGTVVFQKMALPSLIMEILNLVDQLKDFVTRKQGAVVQLRGAEVRNHIAKVVELTEKLKETEKETMIAHIYKGDHELTAAQSVFLDLGEYLLMYADIITFEIRGYYYECLGHLIHRGELDLGHMDLERNTDPEVRAKKLVVARRYKTFLRKLLVCALMKMNIKGVEQKVQEFTEAIIATAYFRIPEFKNKLLSCLKRKSFQPISEWRGTIWDLEIDVTVHPEFLPMFDWQLYFYRHLDTVEDAKYESAINEERWQTRLSKRGLAYFRFISEWATNVKRLFVHKHVPWEDIPGYNVILKSFLLELKERDIEEYPEALVKASLCLLHNSHLISVFVVILFTKTNIYKFKQVMESFKLVSSWLTFVYEKGYGLPITFVSGFFVQALKIALNDDIGLNVANAIWILYQNYQVFRADIKELVVLDIVLGPRVYQFMFHWSEVVRNVFWDFILFRIQSLTLLTLDTLTKVDHDIIEKSQEIISFLESAEHDTSEKLTQEMAPYIKISQQEFSEKKKVFNDWIAVRTAEYQLKASKKSKYGPFDEFPYPDVKIESAFEDEFERRLEEEW